MSWGSAWHGQFLALQALVKRLVNVGLLTITPAGLALVDDADAAAQRATLGLASGLWTPTLSNVANVAASTVRPGTYIQIGNYVLGTIEVDVDPTLAAPTLTQFRLSLPVASNFTTTGQAQGLATSRTNGTVGHVASIIATDDMLVYYNATSTANATLSISFGYEVLP